MEEIGFFNLGQSKKHGLKCEKNWDKPDDTIC